MKIVAYTALTVLIWSLVSCIPSLHGIATPENRIVDDGLLGNWKGRAEIDTTFYMSPPDSNSLFEEINYSTETLSWQFERAVSIGGMKADVEINFTDIARSMLPKDFKTKSTELLPYYILRHREAIDGDTLVTNMKVELTKIKEYLLIDFTPYERMNKTRLTRFATNYVSAHTFAKVIIGPEKLTILPLDGEYIGDLIKNKRIRLKHEIVGENNDVVLTASTDELRTFINNYIDDPDLFDDPEVLFKISE